MPKIAPNLWFDTESKPAAEFYCSIFPNSKITNISHYTAVGPREEGMVLTVDFELDGQRYTALNGGPGVPFNDSISLMVDCKDQAEIDYYWEKLAADGGKEVACGWLNDKFGVRWQVCSMDSITRMLMDPDKEAVDRAMRAMMDMVKLDIAEMEAAFAGK